MRNLVLTTNVILYCRKWEQGVLFYRDQLQLPVLFSTDWFVEFRLGSESRLSVADEARCSVKSSQGAGMTLSLEVDDIENARKYMQENLVTPSEIKTHPWNARVFYIFDPEGHRIEIWQPDPSGKK